MFEIGIPLIDAAGSGDLERVEKYLVAGENVEVQDDGGRTPLIAAVGYGRGSESSLAIASRLMDAGAEISVVDKFDRSAMYFATSEAMVDMVQLFRSAGVRISDSISLVSFVSRGPRRMDASRNTASCYWKILNWMLAENPSLNDADDDGRTALHIACYENITEVALKLITLGADVNILGSGGRSALTLACSRFNLEVVDALLKAGAVVDVADNEYGRTGLLWACSEKGSLEVVKALIEYGAEVNDADKEGCTALMHASIMPKLDIIEQLLKAGAEINQQDKQGRTALAHAAYWREHEDVITLLLKHGADSSIADHSGRLPLDVASEKDHPGAVDILRKAIVQAKVSDWSPLAQAIFDNDLVTFNRALTATEHVDAAEQDGRNALQLAVYHHRKAMVAALILASSDIDAKDPNTASSLHIAVERGFNDIVEMFLKSGAMINNQDSNGETPLYRAITSNNTALVSLLLQHHADPNIADQGNKTPLMVAAGMGLDDIVSQLIAAAADVDQKDKFGRTALFIAAWASVGSAAVTQGLIKAGADVDACADVLGEINVLQQATINGHTEMVRLLVEAGADVNWSGTDTFEKGYQSGQTPLYKAIWKGHEEIVHILLDAGADISITTPKGETLLHLAAKEGRLSMAELLISQGIDINARDHEGDTALKIAATCANKAVVKLLIQNGADLDAAGGSHQWTALHVACWNASLDIVAQLLKVDARQGVLDSDGKTAYQLAEEKAQSKLEHKDYHAILSAFDSSSKD